MLPWPGTGHLAAPTASHLRVTRILVAAARLPADHLQVAAAGTLELSPRLVPPRPRRRRSGLPMHRSISFISTASALSGRMEVASRAILMSCAMRRTPDLR